MMLFSLALGKKRKIPCNLFSVTRDPNCGLDFMVQSCRSDPLVSYGRHFGRTVHALCNVQSLLTNGLLRLGELAGEPEESFSAE